MGDVGDECDGYDDEVILLSKDVFLMKYKLIFKMTAKVTYWQNR